MSTEKAEFVVSTSVNDGRFAREGAVGTVGEAVHFPYLAPDHLVHQLGLRWIEPGDAAAAVEMTLDERTTLPNGSVQGGLLATVIDLVCGQAVGLGLTGPSMYATRDLTVHYLAGLANGPLRVFARVRRQTRSSMIIQVDACDAEGVVGAIATVSFAVRPSALQ